MLSHIILEFDLICLKEVPKGCLKKKKYIYICLFDLSHNNNNHCDWKFLLVMLFMFGQCSAEQGQVFHLFHWTSLDTWVNRQYRRMSGYVGMDLLSNRCTKLGSCHLTISSLQVHCMVFHFVFTWGEAYRSSRANVRPSVCLSAFSHFGGQAGPDATRHDPYDSLWLIWLTTTPKLQV